MNTNKLVPDKIMIKTRIKNWYKIRYSDDELGNSINKEVTFEHLFYALDCHADIYKFLGVGDSLIRERVFNKLAQLMGCDPKYVFDQWYA